MSGYDHVAERSGRSIVFLPDPYTPTFRYNPPSSSPPFGCLNNLRVLCSLSVNSPKFMEPEHSCKGFKKSPLNPNLSQFNPVHIFLTLFLTSALVLSTYLRPSLSSSWYFSITFSWTICVCACACARAFLFLHACCVSCHLIVLDFIVLIIFFIPWLDSSGGSRTPHCLG
jgi:hypothetical protein